MDYIQQVDTSLVSLIIPVYNVRLYLKKCLISVVDQTYKNLNVIIIDDGSTDGSGKICDAYADKYSNVTVFHTENKGLSAARNYGLDHINPETEYIAFLDSDDWMEKDAIQKLYDAASKHNHVTYENIMAIRNYVAHESGEARTKLIKNLYAGREDKFVEPVVFLLRKEKSTNTTYFSYYTKFVSNIAQLLTEEIA